MVRPNPKSQIPNPNRRTLWDLGFGIWDLLIAAVVLASVSGLLAALVPLLFGSPLPMVHVRWASVADADRRALEQQFRLTEAARLDDGLWAYVPADTSPDALRAIVTHPSVADTDGINRRTFAIADNPPLTPRRGGLLEGAPAWLARAIRALAYLLGGLAGVLVIAVAVATLAPPLMRGAVRARPGRSLRRTYTFTARSNETFAVVALFIAAVAWRFLTFTGFSNDHYAHLVMAQQLLMGDVPIRDFADPGWPLTYTLTALGWLITGKTMATEWVISTAGFAIGAACTVAAAYRLSGSLAIATVVTLIEILIFPRAYSYPKVLMYAAGAWALMTLAAQPSSRRRLVLMAAIVAIAFLFRHDHGLFIGIGSAVCVALASRADGWRVVVSRVALLTAITAIFLLPWIVFVTLNGGMVAYLEAGLDYSRAEASATRLDAWPLAGPAAWLFWLFWSVTLACSIIAVRRMTGGRERWPGEAAAIAALIVIAVLVNASFLRESLDVRVSDAIVPVALLGAWALGLCWIGRWRNRLGQRAVQLATIVVVVASGIAAARVAGFAGQYDDSGIAGGIGGIRAHAAEVSQRLRSQHREDVPSRYSLALRPFFDYVDRCTSPSDRLIVTGEFPDVLVLAGRRFAGDGIVFGSWYSSVTHQDRTIARLEDDPALFVLHTGDYESFRMKYEQVAAYLERRYRPMADVPVDEGGTIQILVAQSRTAAGVDAMTGWPCFPRAG
jgi:hypothetical protein